MHACSVAAPSEEHDTVAGYAICKSRLKPCNINARKRADSLHVQNVSRRPGVTMLLRGNGAQVLRHA